MSTVQNIVLVVHTHIEFTCLGHVCKHAVHDQRQIMVAIHDQKQLDNSVEHIRVLVYIESVHRQFRLRDILTTQT